MLLGVHQVCCNLGCTFWGVYCVNFGLQQRPLVLYNILRCGCGKIISFWTYSRPATRSSNNKQKILYYRIQTGVCLWSNMLMTLRKTIHTLLYSLPCGRTAARRSCTAAKIHKSVNASWAPPPPLQWPNQPVELLIKPQFDDCLVVWVLPCLIWITVYRSRLDWNSTSWSLCTAACLFLPHVVMEIRRPG